MTTETVEKDTARSQAKAQLESITGMLERLEHSRKCSSDDDCADWKGDSFDDYHDEESAQQAIYDDPLEVSVRSDWHSQGATECPEGEYLILLCTGGPACRITGSIDQHGEPDSAIIEYQDWGTPWTEYYLSLEEREPLLEYARHFIFAQ